MHGEHKIKSVVYVMMAVIIKTIVFWSDAMQSGRYVTLILGAAGSSQ